MIFIVFCCAVGCGAVFSFYYYGNDWLAVTASSAEDDADNEAPTQQPEKKLYGKQVVDGETYYYDSNGEKMTGIHRIGEKYYYFAADGVMLKIGESQLPSMAFLCRALLTMKVSLALSQQFLRKRRCRDMMRLCRRCLNETKILI